MTCQNHSVCYELHCFVIHSQSILYSLLIINKDKGKECHFSSHLHPFWKQRTFALLSRPAHHKMGVLDQVVETGITNICLKCITGNKNKHLRPFSSKQRKYLRAQWRRQRRHWAWVHRWRCWSWTALDTWGWSPPPAEQCTTSQTPATATASLQNKHKKSNHMLTFPIIEWRNLQYMTLTSCAVYLYRMTHVECWMGAIITLNCESFF